MNTILQSLSTSSIPIILEPIVCEAGELKIENDTLIICAQGEWHTLCAQSWTTLQATVACRQMGLNPVG